MQRLRSSGSSIWGNLVSTPRLKRKASNTWAAVQDAFFSTKDTFERNKVVFTVGTSIASVATAWIGYSLRYYHETRIDQRLETIEKAMRNSNNLEHSELREIAGSGSISAPACFATAGTTLIIGSKIEHVKETWSLPYGFCWYRLYSPKDCSYKLLSFICCWKGSLVLLNSRMKLK
ncbi:hypothetical protein SO802_015374 [Lithocarpus litseifolius]|uniref:Uncharacterized protein n=1 Tax=Lithocarpus litseifolius TaxID=425828 RepID=A0AAW2CTI3_9ROSI